MRKFNIVKLILIISTFITLYLSVFLTNKAIEYKQQILLNTDLNNLNCLSLLVGSNDKTEKISFDQLNDSLMIENNKYILNINNVIKKVDIINDNYYLILGTTSPTYYFTFNDNPYLVDSGVIEANINDNVGSLSLKTNVTNDKFALQIETQNNDSIPFYYKYTDIFTIVLFFINLCIYFYYRHLRKMYYTEIIVNKIKNEKKGDFTHK